MNPNPLINRFCTLIRSNRRGLICDVASCQLQTVQGGYTSVTRLHWVVLVLTDEKRIEQWDVEDVRVE